MSLEWLLSTDGGKLILSFLLTTVCGGILGTVWSALSSQRARKTELLSRRLDRQQELIEELAQVMGERVFRLERLFWTLEDIRSTSDLGDERLQRITKSSDEYYDAVFRWNLNLRRYRVRISHLTTEEIADAFCRDEAESRSDGSTTLYGRFVRAHYAVKDLRDAAMKQQPTTDEGKIGAVRAKIAQLYDAIDDFLKQLQGSFEKA